MEERLRMDTAWVDSLTYDTIVEKKYMHYLPDDVILRAFKELNYFAIFDKVRTVGSAEIHVLLCW